MKNNKELTIVLPPGPDALTAFLQGDSAMFNLSEMERLANLPDGTIRQIRSSGRVASFDQYQAIQKSILPKLLQLVMILQHYPNKKIYY